MTRHEVHKILQTPFLERSEKGLPTFEWEHCAMAFYKIPNSLAMNHLLNSRQEIVLMCESKSGVYYFGVGLKDCEYISLTKLKKLLRYGTWYVYTWAD